MTKEAELPRLATFNRDDAALMLLCTVRYALGRRSYIVGFARSMVKKMLPRLAPQDIENIIRDIREEHEWVGKLGNYREEDWKEWLALAEELEEHV